MLLFHVHFGWLVPLESFSIENIKLHLALLSCNLSAVFSPLFSFVLAHCHGINVRWKEIVSFAANWAPQKRVPCYSINIYSLIV